MAPPLALRIMAALGLIAGGLGLPPLLVPATVRRWLGLKDTPQMAYVLRIVGTMLAALGLILVSFAVAYWDAIR